MGGIPYPPALPPLETELAELVQLSRVGLCYKLLGLAAELVTVDTNAAPAYKVTSLKVVSDGDSMLDERYSLVAGPLLPPCLTGTSDSVGIKRKLKRGCGSGWNMACCECVCNMCACHGLLLRVSVKDVLGFVRVMSVRAFGEL
jgi:hypothetical protein